MHYSLNGENETTLPLQTVICYREVSFKTGLTDDNINVSTILLTLDYKKLYCFWRALWGHDHLVVWISYLGNNMYLQYFLHQTLRSYIVSAGPNAAITIQEFGYISYLGNNMYLQYFLHQTLRSYWLPPLAICTWYNTTPFDLNCVSDFIWFSPGPQIKLLNC